MSKSNRHRATVIEIYENGFRAAVKFTNGRFECVTKRGTNAINFQIGQKGMVDLVIVVSVSRDSDISSQSNFETALEMLGGISDNVMYVAEHEFMGQKVFDRNVVETTIDMGLII